MTWAAILGFIQALPKLIDLINRLEKSFGPDWSQKAAEIVDAYGKVRNAQTQDERDAALKSISNAWSK